MVESFFDNKLEYLKNNISSSSKDLLSLANVEGKLNNNILDKYSLDKFNELLSGISDDKLKETVIKLSRKEINLSEFEVELNNYRANIVSNINIINER